MLETPFPLFISKKAGEIPIFGTFFSEKSILGYISLKIDIFRSAMLYYIIVTSYHTLTDFHDFGINGKKRPYLILWYQTIDIEYNKSLDRRRPCLENELKGESNNIIQGNKSV